MHIKLCSFKFMFNHFYEEDINQLNVHVVFDYRTAIESIKL